jgi:hypothetical protein
MNLQNDQKMAQMGPDGPFDTLPSGPFSRFNLVLRSKVAISTQKGSKQAKTGPNDTFLDQF